MGDGITRRQFVGATSGASAVGIGDDGVTVDWSQTYTRGGEARGNDIVATTDGGYLLSCTSAPERGAPSEAWLVKVDADGAREWARSYGGEGDHAAGPVARAPDGGYAFLGVAGAADEGALWFVSVDEDGDERWERTFHDRSWGDLIATADGNYLLAGGTEHTDEEAWLAKVAADGTVRWQSNYVGGEDPTAYGPGSWAAAVVETDAGYAFAGQTERERSGDRCGWIATVDESGTLTDERLVTDVEYVVDLAPVDEDRYVVAGFEWDDYNVNRYCWLAELAPDGSTAWSHRWRHVSPDDLIATGAGYLVVGDHDVPWPWTYFDGWAAAVTRDGDVRWRRGFSNRGAEYFHAAVSAPDGGYALLGSTGPKFPDEDEFHEESAWLVRLVEDGRWWIPDVGPVGGGILALSVAALGAGAGLLRRRRRDAGGE